MLGDGGELLNERWHGDPRALRDEAGGETQKITPLLEEFPGIGPSGAGIFLREVQAVWPSVAPYVDGRVRDGARAAGLPTDAAELSALAGSNEELARLAAALVRVTPGRPHAAGRPARAAPGGRGTVR